VLGEPAGTGGNHWKRRLAAAALAALPIGASSLGAAPVVEARRVGDGAGIRVDGVLDEAAWAGAAWASGFVASEPTFGAAAAADTAVAVLFDDDAIYVGVRCSDSEPAAIRANKLRHRDSPTDDDHVAIVFDTYRDQVRGTVFVVNPLGTKDEALVNGAGRYTWSWDEVWDVATAITPSGWQAEFRIPLRVLRYPSDAPQVWGFNVGRVVRRTQEKSYLAPIPPPHDISSLNYAATLAGLRLGVRPRNVQVVPYLLAGLVNASGAASGESDRTLTEVGGNAKVSLTSDLTLDATGNTDFAQVESDDEQVNLTRFSLFMPEKREFFLENAGLFSFGHFGGGPQHPDVTPFFSRRIGLAQGRTVPIDGGVRLTGKVGREDIGVLAVRTDAVAELGVASAWYTVARIRHDLGDRSYVGGIVTNSRRGSFRSTTTGLDAEWFLTPDLALRSDVLRVTDTVAGTRSAYNLALDLTTDPWGFLFAYSKVDDAFAPDLGFVERDGTRNREALLRYSFRPGRWGVRRVSLRTINNWWNTAAGNVLESSSNALSCEVELDNGDFLVASTSRSFERLFEPFSLNNEVVFAPGGYDFSTTSLAYRTDESRRWGVDALVASGGFYDGEQDRLEAKGWWVASRHLRGEGTVSRYQVTTEQGELDWRLFGVRLTYVHSATMSASLFGQHNSATGATVLNLRLRWILPRESDLFVVANERREKGDRTPASRVREVAVKVNLRFFV